MRRLLFGFALGTAAGVGLKKLTAGEKEPAASWPEAAEPAPGRTTMAEDLRDRARDSAPLDYEGEAVAEADAGEPAHETH
ncbi:MAG TPA: hypothetical protein VEH52_08250 [Gaiellaceae bacterium]|nr:hypothetical protein [Gaiellaceae bacterium]